MPYRKEIFQAPGIYEVKKYHTYRLGGNRVRGPNIQKTDEGLKKRNSRRAKTKLYRLIATNFKRDDLRIDLTYANPEPTAEEAKNRLKNQKISKSVIFFLVTTGSLCILQDTYSKIIRV